MRHARCAKRSLHLNTATHLTAASPGPCRFRRDLADQGFRNPADARRDASFGDRTQPGPGAPACSSAASAASRGSAVGRRSAHLLDHRPMTKAVVGGIRRRRLLYADSSNSCAIAAFVPQRRLAGGVRTGSCDADARPVCRFDPREGRAQICPCPAPVLRGCSAYLVRDVTSRAVPGTSPRGPIRRHVLDESGERRFERFYYAHHDRVAAYLLTAPPRQCAGRPCADLRDRVAAL